jgi:glycosyltransferase involved in cell wall biosynthesis
MRIAFLKSYLLWAYATGGERTHVAWLQALSEAGHEVVMRYAVPATLPEAVTDSLLSIIRRYGLPLAMSDSRHIVYHAHRVTVETIRVKAPPASWITSWLDDLRPDVVIGDLKDMALAPLLPAIWRDRGFLFLQDVETVETLHNVLAPTALARLKRSSFAVTASSKFLQTVAAERLDLDVAVVYPWVDMSPVSTVANVDGSVTMFGTSPEKGFDLFEDVARKMPSHQFLAVAGWNEPERASTVANLRFAPFVLDPADIYGSSSVILAPSQVPEGFGRVALEAMASGRGVVVSDKGALGEVVGDVGVVIPSVGEASACDRWVDAVSALMNADTLRARGEAGIFRARKFREISERQLKRLFGFRLHI